MAHVHVKPGAQCGAGELLGADVGCTEEGELTGVEFRVRLVKVVGDGEAKRRVAEKLEALVIESGVETGGVGQGFFE